jgi:hypothetical protein
VVDDARRRCADLQDRATTGMAVVVAPSKWGPIGSSRHRTAGSPSISMT